jgi:hypothetical protein
MRKFLLVLLLAGCGPNKDIVKVNDDTYMLGSQDRWAASGSQIKAKLYEDAAAFCASSGKKLQALGDKSVDYALGKNEGYGAQIQFRCK